MNARVGYLVALGVAIALYALSRTQRGQEIAADIVGGAVDKVKDFIGDEEGEELTVYLDNATPPKWTVGIGHVVRVTDRVTRDGVAKQIHPFGPVMTITPEESAAFFRVDSKEATNAVDDSCKRLATTNQRTAMISLAFNVGGSAFRNSTLIKLFNAGDITGAANQFSRWVYSGSTTPNAGLVNRRERERKLFLTV